MFKTQFYTWCWAFYSILAVSPVGAISAEQAAIEDSAQSAKDEAETRFLRLVRDDDDEPNALETAITTYDSAGTSNQDVVVDLVGAVHVADLAYFRSLNELFRNYDAVLYELVAPPGTRVPKGGVPRTSSVSMLQGGMTQMLNLAFQLDCVDYTQNNMVHADISPAEFSKSMRDRGESFVQIFFRMMGQAMAQQAQNPGKSSDARILAALFSKRRDHQLKRIMAEQFEDMKGALNVFEGPDGSTLVTVRNQRAMDVLRREINAGKERFAIFFGAAHMPDMEERLIEQFGMQKKDQRWLLAWDLSESADAKAKNPSK